MKTGLFNMDASEANRPSLGIRWWELLPEVGLAAGLTMFLLDEPDAATSAFKSTRAITLMVASGAAWLIVRAALFRLNVRRVVRVATFSVAAMAALAVVVLPAYRNSTVVESLASRPDAETGGQTAETTDAPRPLRRASFRGVDHRASGDVVFYERAGGFVIGLEEIDIQPGPDYDLYLVPGAEREDRENGTRIGDLKGNRGTQFYDVPSSVDVARGAWTVLVWCQTFAVPIATATPA